MNTEPFNYSYFVPILTLRRDIIGIVQILTLRRTYILIDWLIYAKIVLWFNVNSYGHIGTVI